MYSPHNMDTCNSPCKGASACHNLQDHLVQPQPESPDISPHSSRTPSRAAQAPPVLPSLRGLGVQGTDLVSPVKGSHEGRSAVGSRLSSVSTPVQVVQAMVASEPQSPDPRDPIPAKWPPQHSEGPEA